MPFLTKGKTNWRYILIVLILAVIVGGGILWWIEKQEVPPAELPEIKKPEKIKETVKPPTIAGTTVFCCDSVKLDLNNDGVEELIIFEGERGASGNGPIFIYEEINGSWQKIGELKGNLVFIYEGKTDEYYDISTHWHLGAGIGEFCDYKWDKSKRSYYQVSCKVEEIGI
jgi:hypothetical protein